MAQRITQFKIFLSSPGDVHEERTLARELITGALPYRPFIQGQAAFEAVSWDDPYASPGLDAHMTPQEAINRKLPKPSDCDIVIVILWGRMGTPLPPEITRADGSTYQSGTEWEFEDAVNAARAGGRPTTLVYQRTEKPTTDLDDPQLREKAEQYQKVKAFFERFRNEDGSRKGSYTTYETIEEFREKLRQHLESVVSGLLEQESSIDRSIEIDQSSAAAAEDIEGDITVCDAIQYICKEAKWGIEQGLDEIDPKASAAIDQAAYDGKLIVRGKLVGMCEHETERLLERIPADYWDKHRIDLLSSCMDEKCGGGKTEHRVYGKDDLAVTRYNSLVISRQDMKRLWPAV